MDSLIYSGPTSLRQEVTRIPQKKGPEEAAQIARVSIEITLLRSSLQSIHQFSESRVLDNLNKYGVVLSLRLSVEYWPDDRY
jgi:hypothetical protein